MISGTRDMALCAKCLLHKYEYLSSDPQCPQKKKKKNRHGYTPVTPVLQRILDAGWLVSLGKAAGTRFSKEILYQKLKGRSEEEDTQS